MGWTGTQKPSNVRAYFENQLTWESESEARRVVGIAMTRGVCYAAQEIRDKQTGQVRTVAVIILINYDAGVMTYKDMGECDGPTACDCPLRILNCLSKTTNELALAWRERCRVRAGRKIPPFGAMVRFTEPLRFADGTTETDFTVERWGKRRSASADACPPPLSCVMRELCDESGFGCWRAWQ
ncbi:MAG: hypothetical protein AAF610_14865 [Pseudomonadota bacterium]